MFGCVKLNLWGFYQLHVGKESQNSTVHLRYSCFHYSNVTYILTLQLWRLNSSTGSLTKCKMSVGFGEGSQQEFLLYNNLESLTMTLTPVLLAGLRAALNEESVM